MKYRQVSLSTINSLENVKDRIKSMLQTHYMLIGYYNIIFLKCIGIQFVQMLPGSQLDCVTKSSGGSKVEVFPNQMQ